MHILILLLIFFAAAPSSAELFKCKKRDGTIYYFEKPCIVSDNPQEITKRDLALLRFELQQKQADIIKEQRRRIREELTAERQRQAQQRRRLRMQAKCETVKQQIAQLQLRYKQGYTVTQGLAIDRKLAECNGKLKRFCSNE